eukprot:s3641_g2.t1
MMQISFGQHVMRGAQPQPVLLQSKNLHRANRSGQSRKFGRQRDVATSAMENEIFSWQLLQSVSAIQTRQARNRLCGQQDVRRVAVKGSGMFWLRSSSSLDASEEWYGHTEE